MKKKIVAILGVLVIAVVIASSGCIGGGNSAKDMAKMVPEDASTFGHSDVQTMRDDKDLEAIYEKMTERLYALDELGLDIDDINHMAVVSGEEGDYELSILKGNFDLEDVRDELDDADFDEDEYKGIEIWKRASRLGGDFAFAISGDTLIAGNKDSVKDCIKVMKGSEKSVYDDNEDFRDVIDRLPRGISTVVNIPYKNALAAGIVWMKEDKDTFKMKGVAKFDDEDEAADEKSDTKREMKEKGEWFDVEAKQSGKFLESTAKIDIEDFDIENFG
jgi:hypothetical protein